MNREPIAFTKVYYGACLGYYDGDASIKADTVNRHLAIYNADASARLKGQFDGLVMDAGYSARNIYGNGSIYFDITTSRPMTADEMQSVSDYVAGLHKEISKGFNRKALNDFGTDRDNYANVKMDNPFPMFIVRQHSYPDDYGSPQPLDPDLGYVNGHEITVRGDADDNFSKITVQLQDDNTYRYVYSVKQEGFKNLPTLSHPIRCRNGSNAIKVRDGLQESYDVRDVNVSRYGDDILPDEALITFKSKELLDVYGMADRIEEIRLGRDMDFVDAVADITESSQTMEQ